jgi:hypothetical protein
MADNNINMNNNNTNAINFNIFTPLPPVLKNEKTIAFKYKVDELCKWLYNMAQIAFTVSDQTLLKKEE